MQRIFGSTRTEVTKDSRTNVTI